MARPRSHKNAVAKALDGARVPVHVLDERRSIIYANEALLEWLGVTLDRVLGVRCDYHTDVSLEAPETLVCGLCPPPESWDGGTGTCIVCCGHGDNVRRRNARWLALAGRDSTKVMVWADEIDLSSNDAGDSPDVHAEIARLRQLRSAEYALDRFLGSSATMTQVRRRMELAIQGDVNVLITGPAGSGKELVARMIHAASDTWGSVPLVPLACPLLDDELLESTVTALMQRCAELQLERPPCLLLLDFDQLSPVAQQSLTGILSIGELDLRVLATATTANAVLLEREEFRTELVRQVGTLEIELPALRDRTDDLPMLIQGEIERRNRRGGRQIQGVTREALEYWLAYDWPGNMDELTARVGEAFDMASSGWLDEQALPPVLRFADDAMRYPATEKEAIQLDEYLEGIEKELTARAMRAAKGNKAEAARLLGVTRSRLLRRLPQLGLEEEGA